MPLCSEMVCFLSLVSRPPLRSPIISDVSVVLSFLQEMLDKQLSSSTIKVYAAVIAAFYDPIAIFYEVPGELPPPHPCTVPAWDLPTILRALKGPQLFQSTSLRALLFETTLLLELASVKRVGDLQASSSTLLAWNLGLTTPMSSWNQGCVVYLRCSPLRSEPRS